jgi:hypothetical protein
VIDLGGVATRFCPFPDVADDRHRASTPTLPAERAAERKSRRSTSGAGARISRQTKRPSRIGAAVVQAIRAGDNPKARASVIAMRSAVSPGASRNADLFRH